MSVRSSLERAFARAVLYRLCATALGYPAPGRLAEVTRLARHAAQGAGGSLATPLAALASAAASVDGSPVGTEYVLLFDGAARCAPYEGAYGPPQMAGKAAQLADIAGFYTAFGLEPAGVQSDVEDHIAAELEFMSALALKEAWAMAEGHHEHADTSRHASAAFLSDHLGRWAPAFAESLDKVSEGGYYRAVAGVLRAWIAADAEQLGVVLAPLAPAPAGADDREPLACPMTDDDGVTGVKARTFRGGP